MTKRTPGSPDGDYKSNSTEESLEDALKIPGVIRARTYALEHDFCWIDGENGAVFIDGTLSPSELRRIADHLDPPALRTMDTAPRDRTPVIVKLRDDLNTIRDDLGRWNGLFAVMRYQDDLLLWGYHGPLGQGGFPDEWMVGWAALPECSASVPEIPDSSNPSEIPNSSPVIPEGWRLVPVEADRFMREQIRCYSVLHLPGEIWRHALNAAPKHTLRTEAAVRAEARREALEEAAKACALLAESFTGHAAAGALQCRDAIRALIDRP